MRLAPLFVVLAVTTAHAETRTVGPGQAYETIAAAAAAAADGDVIEILPATYREAVTWRANRLTVRGIGGRPVIDMTGLAISNGKAIFVSAGADFTVDNITFVGASVNDANGAGIRWEGPGGLTVRNCIFRSNENGILGGGQADNVGVIENNEFVDNGRGDVGYTHSVYINEAAEVTFRGNWTHALWPDGPDIGHLFKSRARKNFVLYNRITAEDSHSSYEINIPQGGEAYVIGNLIQQKVGGQRTMISFADGDGTQHPDSKLYVINNTFVSENPNATFVRTTNATAPILVVNNLLVGTNATVVSGGIADVHDNLVPDAPGFVDGLNYDYALTAGSMAVDLGVDPGVANAMSLAATEQYKHPAGTEYRGQIGSAIDIGAYEFGNLPVGGDDGGGDGDQSDGDLTDDVADGDGGGDAGGCCGTSNGATGSGALAAILGLLARRRRR